MEGDLKAKLVCRVCGCTNFYKDAGFYYCETCETQNDEIREEIFDMRVDPSTKLRKIKIKHADRKHNEPQGWTTWEIYNFALIGLTEEMIELGASPDIKFTVLQLWSTYLSKLQVAFTSISRKSLPKLSKQYNKNDAEIIYGKIQSKKKIIKRHKIHTNSTNQSVVSATHSGYSSGTHGGSQGFHRNKKLLINSDYEKYLKSQTNSDAISAVSISAYSSNTVRSFDKEERISFNKFAKEEKKKIKKLAKNVSYIKRVKYREKHITSQYKTGPCVITGIKLWAIVYLAMRIHKEPIQLGDMLRFAREGHMSYYRLDHLIPSEVKLSQNDVNFLTQNTEITHKGLRKIAARMAKFIGIRKMSSPNLLPLISRYCQELGLPRGVLLYAERFIALSPPTMNFDFKKSDIPNYEARAMAFIIVVLKVLFGLDGITECTISKIAERINILKKKNEIDETFSNVICNKWEEKYICQRDTNSPCIIVHGGIGDCKDFTVIEKITACQKAASIGYKKLKNGRNSIEAVEAALWWLECDEFFNCGYGSVLNEIGQVQMDAGIMDGDKFECGSVAAVSDIEHPISLARYVLENLPNNIIVGESAKQLAQFANINLLSHGNMVAPTAYLAYKLSETGNSVADYNVEDLENIQALQSSVGTVGCVAWDGCSIAAGTTTGGLNRKMVGRVGDSPLLGCGTYADKNVGCSLTGHGESIIKLGMARRIADDINQGYDPRTALQRNLDYMLIKFTKNSGGIVLTKDGSWDIYFTYKRMPYAVIKNNEMIFGADLNERQTDVYKDLDANDFCSKQDVLDTKLFSFCEWQRYIECRKNILVNKHYPTKLKYDPTLPLSNNMYLNFLEFIKSKKDGENPEVINYKHLLPRDLSDAMKRCFEKLNQDTKPSEDVTMFNPSLTPLYSYLQQLWENSSNEIPDILKTDFYETKVGYMTHIKDFQQLAAQCNINLNIVNSRLHFINKIVPYFERNKMQEVSKLKEDVQICDFNESEEENIKKVENFASYIDKNIPCYTKIDDTKLQYFDDVRNSLKMNTNFNYNDHNDFIFGDILPDGKLLIPEENGSTSDDDVLHFKDTIKQKPDTMDINFYQKYNIQLTQYEEESILKPQELESIEDFMKRKMHRYRNSKGQFMKASEAQELMNSYNFIKPNIIDNLNFYDLHNFTGINLDNDNLANNDLDSFNDLEMSLFKVPYDIPKNEEIIFDGEYNYNSELNNINNYFDLSDISILNDDILDQNLDTGETKFIFKTDIDSSEQESENMKFFRPCEDYWMYHCIFSRVKAKNFELFEKVLPRSFRWLLNECANVIEMTTEELYEEICTIENFYSQILNPNNVFDHSTRLHRSLIISKW